MAPRLTIAIPTVNRASLLGRAIESALAQTSSDIEIIVSDNGSSDATPEVMGRYSSPLLRQFRHESTMPAARHGQFLMEQARGEFFLGLSDDDFLEPDFAMAVLGHFDAHPGLSFVYTGCAVHYEDLAVPAIVGPPVEPGFDFLAAHYAGQREVSWCACVTRTRDLLALGPQPDDRIIGDMFFWTRIAFQGPVGCVPRVLSHYVLLRPASDNISHGSPVLDWVREEAVMAREVEAEARARGVEATRVARFAGDARAYVSRSGANQMVWRRLRGASRGSLLSSLPGCLPFIRLDLATLTRASAALLLPRTVLRRLILAKAGRMAKERCGDRTGGPRLS
jgi:hypothetical protein